MDVPLNMFPILRGNAFHFLITLPHCNVNMCLVFSVICRLLNMRRTARHRLMEPCAWTYCRAAAKSCLQSVLSVAKVITILKVYMPSILPRWCWAPSCPCWYIILGVDAFHSHHGHDYMDSIRLQETLQRGEPFKLAAALTHLIPQAKIVANLVFNFRKL